MRRRLWHLLLLAFPAPVARWVDTGEWKWDWVYPLKPRYNSPNEMLPRRGNRPGAGNGK